MLLIRDENNKDFPAVRELLIRAFAGHPHSNQTEHRMVEKLRAADAMSLGLVAEDESGGTLSIVGHIAFSKVLVDGADVRWYGLAPVAVQPECWGQGIGSRLIEAGLDLLRRRGARGCVLIGEPVYYNRFGFVQRPGLHTPNVPDEYLLALPLEGDCPTGSVLFHEAFS